MPDVGSADFRGVHFLLAVSEVDELFRIETNRISLAWHGPVPRRTPTDSPSGGSGEAAGPMGQLRIIPRRGGLTLEPGTYRRGIPEPAARDLAQRAGPPLFEETAYSLLLSSRSGARVELRHRDPVLLQNLHSTPERNLWHGTLNFRSQVGMSRLSIFVDGQPELDLEVEIFPSKLEYRADYAAMMGEVQDLAAGLALEYLRSTHQLASPVGGRDSSHLDWIALLRHLIKELEQAVDYIAQRPLRGLRRVQQMVRVETLRRSDGALRRAVRAGIGRGPRMTLGNGVPVRRYLPERRPEPTLDTPEHRWLAVQLRQLRFRLAQVAQEEKERQQLAPHIASSRDRRAMDELQALEKRISRLEEVEPLAAAQSPPPAGFSSLQLQGAPGYREAYRALTILRQGLQLGGGPVELSVKDVHLLYEYWCFLGILRLVATILGTRIPADRLLEVRSEGLRIRLQKGRLQSVPFTLPGGRTLEVTYNPSFQDPDALLPQQPDLVLTLTDPHWPTVRLVLDAKYRVEDSASFVERFGVPGPPPDAVNVLHRYRDAILETESLVGEAADSRTSHLRRTVIEGAALYPLSAERASAFEESRFWNSLERLGIGAVPFLPGSTVWLERWLRGVLRRSGWAVADAVISHAAEEQRSKWKRSAAIPVLIGSLRGEDPEEHLAWIKQEHMYYLRLTPSQPRQLQTNEVAFYEPSQLYPSGEPGRVRLYAPVERIDVVPRADIETPWQISGDANDLCVLYRVGALQELDAPILNRGLGGQGRRFSTHRWSSALGLERATELTELLLESVTEWTVYDTLRARGIGFGLQVARNAGEDVGLRGRAWFVLDNVRIRVLGPDAVEVHRHGQVHRGPVRSLNSLLGFDPG